jgi:hypothetical protein
VQTLLRPGGLLHVHDTYGHIHFFTKEIAIKLLQDAGYEVLDSFYTPRALEIPTALLGRRLMHFPRKLLFALNQDFAVRLVGGFSLLVLAR